VDGERFDVEAKLEEQSAGTGSESVMIKLLLADRFKLQVPSGNQRFTCLRFGGRGWWPQNQGGNYTGAGECGSGQSTVRIEPASGKSFCVSLET
jgi:hypothetical protein